MLGNFKRFRTLELNFDKELNILIGDNEAGKSSVLQALEIVMSVSRSHVESLGLESLFNAQCIEEYMGGLRAIKDLPIMFIDVYVEGVPGHEINGKNYHGGSELLDGMRLVCRPHDLYSKDIAEILKDVNL